MATIECLTQESLTRAIDELVLVDEDLARVVTAFGYPPLWERPTGFPTLIYIVLEQQVSLASARAAFDRLAAAGPVTPESFLDYSDPELRTIGFSRQKAGYCRGLAQSLLAAELDLVTLQSLDDQAARTALTRLKGIGPWTADIYLLTALRRPNIWPTGDLALVQALQGVKSLPGRPNSVDALAIAEQWHPWRAAAARVLWHWYLSTPRQRGKNREGVQTSAPASTQSATGPISPAPTSDDTCPVKTA